MVLFLSVKDNSYLAQSGTDIQWNIYHQVAKYKKSFKSQTFSDKLKLLKKKSTLVRIDTFHFLHERQNKTRS